MSLFHLKLKRRKVEDGGGDARSSSEGDSGNFSDAILNGGSSSNSTSGRSSLEIDISKKPANVPSPPIENGNGRFEPVQTGSVQVTTLNGQPSKYSQWASPASATNGVDLSRSSQQSLSQDDKKPVQASSDQFSALEARKGDVVITALPAPAAAVAKVLARPSVTVTSRPAVPPSTTCSPATIVSTFRNSSTGSTNSGQSSGTSPSRDGGAPSPPNSSPPSSVSSHIPVSVMPQPPLGLSPAMVTAEPISRQPPPSHQPVRSGLNQFSPSVTSSSSAPTATYFNHRPQFSMTAPAQRRQSPPSQPPYQRVASSSIQFNLATTTAAVNLPTPPPTTSYQRSAGMPQFNPTTTTAAGGPSSRPSVIMGDHGGVKTMVWTDNSAPSQPQQQGNRTQPPTTVPPPPPPVSQPSGHHNLIKLEPGIAAQAVQVAQAAKARMEQAQRLAAAQQQQQQQEQAKIEDDIRRKMSSAVDGLLSLRESGPSSSGAPRPQPVVGPTPLQLQPLLQQRPIHPGQLHHPQMTHQLPSPSSGAPMGPAQLRFPLNPGQVKLEPISSSSLRGGPPNQRAPQLPAFPQLPPPEALGINTSRPPYLPPNFQPQQSPQPGSHSPATMGPGPSNQGDQPRRR